MWVTSKNLAIKNAELVKKIQIYNYKQTIKQIIKGLFLTPQEIKKPVMSSFYRPRILETIKSNIQVSFLIFCKILDIL